MIRRGYGIVRRASNIDAASTSQAACFWCHSRSLHASGSRLEKENEVTKRSALDDLFDAPDAYDHHIGNSSSDRGIRNNAFKSQKIPRTVLGGNDFSNDISSQLNQEWEGAPRKRNDYQPSSNHGAPLRGPQQGSRRNDYKGTMTPHETAIFSDIFANFFKGEAEGKAVTPPEDDGAFGSSFSNNKMGTLQDFQQRNRLEMKKKAARERYFSSVLSERISLSETSKDEIERGIDEAREEIVACNNVSELWEWASRNVWGGKTAEIEQEMNSTRVKKGKSTSLEMVTEDAATEPKEVRFGMLTPHYAPVLLLLLTNLRDRFTSPQSALSVLRIAKNLGADSFVLGCSPQLYAENIRTQWMVLRDLQGAKDTLREAKDTGILGRPTSVALLSDQHNLKGSEESRLREIALQVKRDVQFQVTEGVKRLPEGVTPSIYERQLELVEEMDKIRGPTPRPLPRDVMNQRAKRLGDRYARR